MVVGVPGEVVANLVDLEVREDHAQILDQQMEDHNVLDLQVKLVMRMLAQVMKLHFLFNFC